MCGRSGGHRALRNGPLPAGPESSQGHFNACRRSQEPSCHPLLRQTSMVLLVPRDTPPFLSCPPAEPHTTHRLHLSPRRRIGSWAARWGRMPSCPPHPLLPEISRPPRPSTPRTGLTCPGAPAGRPGGISNLSGPEQSVLFDAPNLLLHILLLLRQWPRHPQAVRFKAEVVPALFPALCSPRIPRYSLRPQSQQQLGLWSEWFPTPREV